MIRQQMSHLLLKAYVACARPQSILPAPDPPPPPLPTWALCTARDQAVEVYGVDRLLTVIHVMARAIGEQVIPTMRDPAMDDPLSTPAWTDVYLDMITQFGQPLVDTILHEGVGMPTFDDRMQWDGGLLNLMRCAELYYQLWLEERTARTFC